MSEYVTRDSGDRDEYAGGMLRDTNEGKPRFDLLWPALLPFKEQLLTRAAALMARGAQKYGNRNWEQAQDEAALERYRDSAFRHFMQWMSSERELVQDETGEWTDATEDHAAAVIFNLMGAEYVKWRIQEHLRISVEDLREAIVSARVFQLLPVIAPESDGVEVDTDYE